MARRLQPAVVAAAAANKPTDFEAIPKVQIAVVCVLVLCARLYSARHTKVRTSPHKQLAVWCAVVFFAVVDGRVAASRPVVCDDHLGLPEKRRLSVCVLAEENDAADSRRLTARPSSVSASRKHTDGECRFVCRSGSGRRAARAESERF